jgi:hypothetical protein
MICLGCGCVFCPDTPAEDDIVARVYCSAECKDRTRNRRHGKARKARHREAGLRTFAGQQPAEKFFCSVCGKVASRRPGSLRHWCSKSCETFFYNHPRLTPPELAAEWARISAAGKPGPGAVCPSGKIRHQDRADALASAKRVARLRFSGYRGWLSVYQCVHCGGWHMTSKPQRRRERMSA